MRSEPVRTSLIPDGADFASATKSRSPLRQIKSAPPFASAHGPGRRADAFSSTRLTSRQDPSASRSAAGFQIPCLAWWIREADLRAISVRISARVRLSNSAEITSSEASSASLKRNLSWCSSPASSSFFPIIGTDVIHRITISKKESESAPRCLWPPWGTVPNYPQRY